MLESNSFSFSENEYLHSMTFRNIHTLCNGRETEWLKYFIEKYSCFESCQQEDLKYFLYTCIILKRNLRRHSDGIKDKS